MKKILTPLFILLHSMQTTAQATLDMRRKNHLGAVISKDGVLNA